jgi:hypothetical protein
MQLHNRTCILVLIAALAFVQGCKKEQPGVDFHCDYFDLSPGRFIEYEVTEIKHDQSALVKHDTSYYQLRTVIGDTVIDNSGRMARKFLRYKRDNSSASWSLSDVWTAIIDSRRAELIEENQRMVKLVFAPTIDKVWDLNAYNAFPELECYYRDLHEPGAYNGLSFDSSLVVEQEDFFSLVDYRRKYEVYAKGVGLIHKYYKDLQIANFDTLNVLNGDELFFTITGYGFE